MPKKKKPAPKIPGLLFVLRDDPSWDSPGVEMLLEQRAEQGLEPFVSDPMALQALATVLMGYGTPLHLEVARPVRGRRQTREHLAPGE